MRTVDLHLTTGSLNLLCLATSHDEALRALGKLVGWGLGDEESPGYRHCRIEGRDLDGARGEPELIASYYRGVKEANAPKPDFVIGAVWNGSKFGFHS